MRQLKKNIRILLVLALLLTISGCVPYSTGTTEVGVLVVKWNPFGKQGVMDKWYPEAETNFFVPYLTQWYTFNTNLQYLEMTYSEKTGDIKGRDDLLFKTIDGNDIGLDVIISYRIIKEKAPDILRNIASNDDELRKNIVRTVSRSHPRDIFGELTTEEFYVSANRELKAQKARESLNKILNPYGIVIEMVATKDYRFNPLYQKAIEERKIADQTTEKNKASARAAEQEYKKKIEEAVGEVNKMRAEVDGIYQQGLLEADAYYNSKQEIAQAIEKEGISEAEGTKQMVDALLGPGGEIIVKMKVAEALQNKKILLLPVSGSGLDLKTTDVNRLLEMYGLQKATKSSATSPAQQSSANRGPEHQGAGAVSQQQEVSTINEAPETGQSATENQ